MYEVNLNFISLSRSSYLKLKSSHPLDSLLGELYLLFKHTIDYQSKKISINSLQENSLELRNNINSFVQKYKSKEPKINQLNTYFKDLKENENFFFLPGSEVPTETYTQLYNYLTALNEGKDFETIQNQHKNLYEEFFKVYKASAFDGSRIKNIGEKDKSKRVCRFCGKNSTETTFKKKAHAISESLGNKKIILYEECDECNDKFGSGIEKDLTIYLDLYRNMFGIKGKNGIPKLKGRNYEIINNEGTIEIKHFLDDDEVVDKSPKFKTKLETYDKISLQDIYRAFCKFALSVVDSKYIPDFTETIKWLNGNYNLEKLPKIAILKSYALFAQHPKLILYIRNNSNYDLPFAVAELRFTFLVYVFVIPLAKNGKVQFISDEEYNTFWNFFKHYNLDKNWDFVDFSDSEKKKFVVNLIFEERNKK